MGLRGVSALVVAGLLFFTRVRVSAEPSIVIGPKAWSLIERESGPVNYYATMTEDGTTFVRAQYVPPMKTAVLGYSIPEADRQRVKTLRWTWRARTLPVDGDECTAGKGDSAAVVYATWKRGLRYYTLKYVWSAVGKKGSVCDSKRTPFVAQDTVIVESGGPLGVWRFTEIDLAHQFRHYFEGGRSDAEVPDFVGVAIMTDGDQTRSESSADYGRFVAIR